MNESQQPSSERDSAGSGQFDDNRNMPHPRSSIVPPWGVYEPYAAILPRKRKWIAGLLSMCIPGTGHFYLGLMQKGLVVMLLIIMDIFAIVHFSINMSSIPLITLLALFLPIIYFYSLFDALQSVEKVNAYRLSLSRAYAHDNSADPSPPVDAGKPDSPSLVGWLLVGCGGLFFVFSAKLDWIGPVMNQAGTVIGGVVLIAVGIVLFLKNSSRPK